ncbi:MAG: hypothetical protein O3C40_19655 [Planctomycetota bacterium]|nr:hypothetical protein [Planctomycetota bacterium]
MKTDQPKVSAGRSAEFWEGEAPAEPVLWEGEAPAEPVRQEPHPPVTIHLPLA